MQPPGQPGPAAQLPAPLASPQSRPGASSPWTSTFSANKRINFSPARDSLYWTIVPTCHAPRTEPPIFRFTTLTYAIRNNFLRHAHGRSQHACRQLSRSNGHDTALSYHHCTAILHDLRVGALTCVCSCLRICSSRSATSTSSLALLVFLAALSLAASFLFFSRSVKLLCAYAHPPPLHPC